MTEVDLEKVRADWAERGFSCDLWVDPPGRHWENFVHETDEVVIVMAGMMEFEVAGKIHHPEIGEEVFIPARTVHASRNRGNTIARWLYGYRVLDS